MNQKLFFLNKTFHVQAHRGVQSLFPENTLKAFAKAIELGVDWIELDLVFSKDQEVIIFHDSKIQEKPIANLTLNEIKIFDAGIKNPKFPEQIAVPGEPIPTLRELFAWIISLKSENSKKICFNLEIKNQKIDSDSNCDFASFIRKILDIVSEFQLQDRVYFSSFDKSLLELVRKFDRSAVLALLYYAETFADIESYIQDCKLVSAQIASPCISLITKEIVEKLQKNSLKVVVWTVNDKEKAETLKLWGVSGIISDYPQKFLQDHLR